MARVKWASGVSGVWSDAADWNTGTVPTASDNVTIAATGTYTVAINAPAVARSLTLHRNSATIVDSATLSIGHALAVEAGTFALTNGGNIVGGTLSATGGGQFLWEGGTLTSVTYKGVLDLTMPFTSNLLVRSGIAFENAKGTGPGTIDMTGSNATLTLLDVTSLDNATLDIGNATSSQTLTIMNDNASFGSLTLGPAFDLVQSAGYISIDFAGGFAAYPETLMNQGIITSQTSSLNIAGNNLINQGSIIVGTGDYAGITVDNLTNTGSILVEGGYLSLSNLTVNTGLVSVMGGALHIYGTLDSGFAGTLSVNGGSLYLYTTLTTARLEQFELSNVATLQLSGVLNNTGSISELGAGTSIGTLTVAGGEIFGGAVKNMGVTGLSWQGGTLTNVAFQGDLDLAGSLTIEGNTTFSGPGGVGASLVTLPNIAYVNVALMDVATVDNVKFSLESGTSSLTFYSDAGGKGITTLGLNCSISTKGQNQFYFQNQGIYVSNCSLINSGEISVGSILVVDLGYQGTTGTFTNTGTILVKSGASFTIKTVTVGNLSGGTLSDGTYDVQSNGTFAFYSSNIINTLSATVILDGPNSRFASDYSSQLDQTLATIASAGTLSVLDSRVFTATGNGGTVTNSGVVILGGGTFASKNLILSGGTLEGYGTETGAVSNAGTIGAQVSTLMLTGAVTGAGALMAESGAILDLAGGGTITGAIYGAGTLQIDGTTPLVLDTGVSLAIAHVVEHGSVTLGANVTLTNDAGSTYVMEAFHDVTETLGGDPTSQFINGGSFTASGGGTADIAVAFINNATIASIGGTLSFLASITNDGTISVGGSVLNFADKIHGTGTIDVAAYGTLSLENGAKATQIVDFQAATGIVDLANPLNFGGHFAGFAPGDSIDVLNTAVTKYSFDSGVLTLRDHGTVVARLHFDGSYTTASFVLGTDAHGGTLITHS